MTVSPYYWDRFNQARFGMFSHWGAYAVYGRGEQALFRERLDQRSYAAQARRVSIKGLPSKPPTDLFPVIKLECDGPPRPRPWAADRLWQGDPRRMTAWARARGEGVWADGRTT